MKVASGGLELPGAGASFHIYTYTARRLTLGDCTGHSCPKRGSSCRRLSIHREARAGSAQPSLVVPPSVEGEFVARYFRIVSLRRPPIAPGVMTPRPTESPTPCADGSEKLYGWVEPRIPPPHMQEPRGWLRQARGSCMWMDNPRHHPSSVVRAPGGPYSVGQPPPSARYRATWPRAKDDRACVAASCSWNTARRESSTASILVKPSR